MRPSSVWTLSGLIAVVAAASSASEPAQSTIEPSISQILATQATQAALSPVSNVQGKAFQRFYQVWLENTDYSAALGDPNMQWLASQGITLSNYFATTHPSEPNYAAAAAGDNFGMDNDDFHLIPSNISTVVDLLDTKGISWAEYQEGMPYAGFQGFNFSNVSAILFSLNFAMGCVACFGAVILFCHLPKGVPRPLQPRAPLCPANLQVRRRLFRPLRTLSTQPQPFTRFISAHAYQSIAWPICANFAKKTASDICQRLRPQA